MNLEQVKLINSVFWHKKENNNSSIPFSEETGLYFISFYNDDFAFTQEELKEIEIALPNVKFKEISS
jgi:hypothetical protein